MISIRMERNNISKYRNIFQTIGMFLINEFFVTLVYLKLYNIETNIYNKRKICWSLIICIPAIIFLLTLFSACVKYLMQ